MKHRQPHHGRNGSRHCGRLRVAAAAILTAGLGFAVHPEEVHPATGAWRTDFRLDVYRWELFAHRPPRPGSKNWMPYVAGCWESLTDFVRVARRRGFHVTEDGEIYAGEDEAGRVLAGGVLKVQGPKS